MITFAAGPVVGCQRRQKGNTIAGKGREMLCTINCGVHGTFFGGLCIIPTLYINVTDWV
jgi:hypothetical protein